MNFQGIWIPDEVPGHEREKCEKVSPKRQKRWGHTGRIQYFPDENAAGSPAAGGQYNRYQGLHLF